MHIPFRRDDGDDNCPGETNCMPTYAIIGQDPSEKENDTAFGPLDYGKPGPHRFIGIGMVAGMIFLVLVLYISFGKRPRRVLKGCCYWRRRKDEEVMVEHVAVVLEPSSSSLSSEEKPHRPVTQSKPSGNANHSRKSSSRSKSRKGSRHRTASDGMVHVAKDNERDDAEPEELTRWEVEHVRGVRYEVRTPNDDQPNQRLEVHIQKPRLAYQR